MTRLRSASCFATLLFTLLFWTLGCQAAPPSLDGSPADTEPEKTTTAKPTEFTFSGDPDAAMAEGDFTTAVNLWLQALKATPDSGELHYKLGNAYYQLAQAFIADPDLGGDPGSAFSDAEQYFRRAVELGHGAAGFMQAQSLYMNSALEEALDPLNKYLAAFPEDAAACELAGKINVAVAMQLPEEERAPYFTEAVSRLMKAIELKPELDGAYLTLGDGYLQQGEAKLATDTYMKGITACPNANTLHERFIYMAGAETGPTPDDALAFYTALLEKAGASYSAEEQGRLWWFKASWYGQQGNRLYDESEFNAAAEAYSKQIEAFGKSGEACLDFQEQAGAMAAVAHLSRGYCNMNEERFEEAEKDMFVCLRYYPDDANTIQAIDKLVYYLFNGKRYEAARDFFRRLVKVKGDRHQWWNDFGFFSLETNMRSVAPKEAYEETYDIFEHALALKPDYPRYLNDKGMLIDYYLDPERKRTAEAEELFRKAYELGKEAYESEYTDEEEKATMFSSFTDALVNLGRLYAREGRFEESRAMLKELQIHSPEREEGKMLEQTLDHIAANKPGQPDMSYVDALVAMGNQYLADDCMAEAIGVVRELATLNVDRDDANQFAMILSQALEKRRAERKKGEQEKEEQQEEEG